MGEKIDRREGIQVTARELVQSGHFKTQDEAEKRVRAAVVKGDKQREESR